MEDLKKTNPKMFFMHLLSMVTLYASAIAFINVCFNLIDLAIPSTQVSQYGDSSIQRGLRIALSFLIVMFPTYLWSIKYLGKQYAKNDALKQLGSRKWLIYLTIFIAGLIILFTTVFTLNSFLNGELTVNFALKVVSILFLTGSIFWYYLHDIKK